MEVFVLGSVLIVLAVVFGGVWGTIIISQLMKTRTLKLESEQPNPKLDHLAEGYRQLEERLERLEEEVGFFRELGGASPSERLPPGVAREE